MRAQRCDKRMAAAASGAEEEESGGAHGGLNMRMSIRLPAVRSAVSRSAWRKSISPAQSLAMAVRPATAKAFGLRSVPARNMGASVSLGSYKARRNDARLHRCSGRMARA